MTYCMKKLFFLVIGLLSLSLVSTLEMSGEYDTNVIVYDVDNSIELMLNITNASSGMYNIYTLADISIKPSEIFTIPEGFIEKKFIVSAKDNLDVDGYYSFAYILNHRGVEKVEGKMLVKLMNLEDVIEVSSDSIDPASGEISFYVQNKESVNLKNLTAEFSSILFETTETFDLDANERLEIFVNVDEDKLKKTKAGVYIIESLFQTKSGLKKIEGNLYLGEKKGITSTGDKLGFLVVSETVTKVNVGNVVENVQIKLSKNIFSRLFTTFNIEPIFVERNGLIVEYTWIKQKLNPTEAYVVKATTNYVVPFLVVIVAIIALIGFRRFSETKLEIRKSVSHVKTKNGEFALKIILSLRAKKDIENVTLIDRVPPIVKIYKKFGIVKPDKIDAESRRIHWYIGDLNANEERVFTYIVYSKVGIVGKFSLPEAVAVFEENGKIHEIDSNKVFFMSAQVRSD